jgi:hypothetical protein
MFARWLFVALLIATGLVSGPVPSVAGQEGRQGSGFFRDQDTLPSSYRLYTQTGIGGGLWGLGPNRGKVKKSSFRADAHAGVRDYSSQRSCASCHTEQAKDLHSVRMDIKCTQCHLSKPIAGVHQYYSAMNPIRRHAYVCAKCHEGSSPSFAGYMVHEPSAISPEARDQFPLLYYGVWLMIILAGGVFAFFIPFTLLWLLREYGARLTRGESHG